MIQIRDESTCDAKRRNSVNISEFDLNRFNWIVYGLLHLKWDNIVAY